MSLLLAIIGLGLIQYSSQEVMPQEVNISEIDSSWTGEVVRTEGKIKTKNYAEGHLFLDLSGGESNITVVDFNSENRFSTGEQVAVEGEVEIYRGEMEIIADKIEKAE